MLSPVARALQEMKASGRYMGEGDLAEILSVAAEARRLVEMLQLQDLSAAQIEAVKQHLAWLRNTRIDYQTFTPVATEDGTAFTALFNKYYTQKKTPVPTTLEGTYRFAQDMTGYRNDSETVAASTTPDLSHVRVTYEARLKRVGLLRLTEVPYMYVDTTALVLWRHDERYSQSRLLPKPTTQLLWP